MSTAKKLILFIGVPLAALILVFFVIFPGIPAYVKVKLKYDHIDDTSEAFGLQTVPADFKAISTKGLAMRVPEGYELSETGSALHNEEGKTVMAILGTALYNADLSGYTEGYDPWENYRYGEKEYRSYFRAIGRDYIDPTGPDNQFLWYVRDEVKAKDCLKLRGDDLRVFMEIADSKDISYGMEDTWDIDGEGFAAVAARGKDETVKVGDYWTITLYPDSAGGKNYLIIIRNIPDDTAKQIISSIKLDK